MTDIKILNFVDENFINAIKDDSKKYFDEDVEETQKKIIFSNKDQLYLVKSIHWLSINFEKILESKLLVVWFDIMPMMDVFPLRDIIDYANPSIMMKLFLDYKGVLFKFIQRLDYRSQLHLIKKLDATFEEFVEICKSKICFYLPDSILPYYERIVDGESKSMQLFKDAMVKNDV